MHKTQNGTPLIFIRSRVIHKNGFFILERKNVPKRQSGQTTYVVSQMLLLLYMLRIYSFLYFYYVNTIISWGILLLKERERERGGDGEMTAAKLVTQSKLSGPNLQQCFAAILNAYILSIFAKKGGASDNNGHLRRPKTLTPNAERLSVETSLPV